MNSNERAQHWQDVYTRKDDREVSWYEPEATRSLELIERCGPLSKDARIIDVGGGASRLVDGLLDRGYEAVSVLDIAEPALAKTRARLGADAAARVTWLVSDITRFAPSAHYAVWHDRAVFHFLTQDDDKRAYADIVARAVAPGGHVILGTFALDGPERCSGLPVARYDAEGIAAVLGSAFMLVESLAYTHTTPSGNPQRFTFTRFLHAFAGSGHVR